MNEDEPLCGVVPHNRQVFKSVGIYADKGKRAVERDVWVPEEFDFDVMSLALRIVSAVEEEQVQWELLFEARYGELTEEQAQQCCAVARQLTRFTFTSV